MFNTCPRFCFCFWPQSYVTTRFMLCFSAWQCAFMCIFLHPCHGWGEGGGSGWGRLWGVGGGLIAFCRLLPVASSLYHAHDATLYRSSLAIFDTLMMLRSIDLLLQSSTRSCGGGWGGVRAGGGGGVGVGFIAFCRLLPVASSLRHAYAAALYRSSLAIFDTLMMLRSIGLLLQSLTRSWCFAL